MDKYTKQQMNAFLKDFGRAWYSIDEPAKLLEKYFCIEEGGVVGVKMEGDLCLYIGRIDDSLDDVQNVANSIKVLVKNYLEKNGEENVGHLEVA